MSLELVRHAAYLASVVASWSHMDRFADSRIDFWLPHLDPPVRSLIAHASLIDCPSPYCPRELLQSAAASREKVVAKLLGLSAPAATQPALPLLERYNHQPIQAIESFVGLKSPATQKQLTGILHGALYDRCLREYYPPNLSRRPASAARFMSSSTPAAVSFAHAVPVHQDFVISPRAYLNGVLLQTEVPGRKAMGEACPFRKDHSMDKQGYHLFSCGSHRSIPHDALRDAFHELCTAAGLTSVVEPTNCLTVQDASSKRRPDLLITGLAAGGKDYLVEFTTCDPAADVSLRNPVRSYCTFGSASKAGEHRKRQSYQGLFDPTCFVFLPAAIELCGRCGVALEKLFDDICRSADASKGFTPLRSGIFFKAYWRRVITSRYSRTLFKGAADMQHQLTACVQTLDPSRELALV